MRRSPLLGLLLALALLAGACSGKAKDPTATELRTKIATQLHSVQPSLTTAQAGCYSNLLVEQLGATTINKVDLRDKAPDPAVAKKLAAAAIAATTECGIGGRPTSTTSASTTTSTTTQP